MKSFMIEFVRLFLYMVTFPPIKSILIIGKSEVILLKLFPCILNCYLEIELWFMKKYCYDTTIDD